MGDGGRGLAGLVRGHVLSLREQEFVVAARAVGVKDFQIAFRHILPNISSALIVYMTLNFPATVILESSLSFLGIGIQPPMTSLGNMLGFGRDYLTTAWWIAVFPGVIIFLATLAMSILGDWVRDRLDPTLR